MSRAFDRYMVAHGAGHHLKFRDFNGNEKCAHFLGVLSIVSQAPIRGAFCIGERAATADDVAWEAGVPVAAARKALAKLREVGVLRMDDDLNREVVHDWDEVNPPPRRKPSDEAERTRQRKRAERERQRDDDESHPPARDVTPDVTPPVTPLSRDVTPPEVEGEVENPPNPPSGGVRAVESADVRQVFDAWVEATGRDKARTKLDDKRRKLIRRALGGYPLEDVLGAVRGWKHSPHHRGENATATTYNDLGLLLRDAEHLERFRDLERQRGNGKTGRVDLAARRRALGYEDGAA